MALWSSVGEVLGPWVEWSSEAMTEPCVIWGLHACSDLRALDHTAHLEVSLNSPADLPPGPAQRSCHLPPAGAGCFSLCGQSLDPAPHSLLAFSVSRIL